MLGAKGTTWVDLDFFAAAETDDEGFFALGDTSLEIDTDETGSPDSVGDTCLGTGFNRGGAKLGVGSGTLGAARVERVCERTRSINSEEREGRPE